MLDTNVHIQAFISSFRWFGAGIYKVYSLLGRNPILNCTPDILFFIITFALLAVCLTYTIIKKLEDKTFLTYLVIDISIIISIFNVWFCNILSFPECVFLTTIGLICCFCAIILFSTGTHFYHYIIVSILLTLAGGVYQQYIFIFTIFVIVITKLDVIANDIISFKELVKAYSKPAIISVVSGSVCIIIGKIIQNIFDVEKNGRVLTSINDIFSNVVYYIERQHSFLKGRGFFSTELLTISFIAVAVIWFISFVVNLKKKQHILQTVIVGLSFAFAYVCSYLPGIMANSHAMRTICALFAIFSLFVVGTLAVNKNKFIKIPLLIILVAVFVGNAYNSVNCQLRLQEQNVVDKEWVLSFADKIEEYEAENNIEVETVCYCYDSETDLKVDGMANASTAFSARYSTIAIIEYFSEREFVFVEMTDENKILVFGNNEWEEFNAQEQIIFENSTAFVCFY